MAFERSEDATKGPRLFTTPIPDDDRVSPIPIGSPRSNKRRHKERFCSKMEYQELLYEKILESLVESNFECNTRPTVGLPGPWLR